MPLLPFASLVCQLSWIFSNAKKLPAVKVNNFYSFRYCLKTGRIRFSKLLSPRSVLFSFGYHPRFEYFSFLHIKTAFPIFLLITEGRFLSLFSVFRFFGFSFFRAFTKSIRIPLPRAFFRFRYSRRRGSCSVPRRICCNGTF